MVFSLFLALFGLFNCLEVRCVLISNLLFEVVFHKLAQQLVRNLFLPSPNCSTIWKLGGDKQSIL